MAVRIGKFGMSWLQPAGQAADLLVEAGRAKGAGIAALGQGIGQGIQAFGQNRRAKQIRSEDMALREQSRQDMLAERAADNARQDAEFAMRQDAWKVEVLTANRDKAAQEAELFKQIATDTGDEADVQRAKAAESEAMRFGTALDTLLSSRMNVQGAAPRRGGGDVGGVQVGGKPMSQMTSAELDALMAKSERGEVDYTYRGGATGDMGQGVGPDAPSMPSPVMVNDGGVMSGAVAPMPTAATPATPQVDPRNPYVLMETAKAKMGRAETMLRNPKLGAAARNAYERLRVESAAQYGFAQSLLQDQKSQRDAEMQATEAARKSAEDASAVAALRADLEKRGIKETLPDDLATARRVYSDAVVTDPNSAAAAARKAEAAKTRAENQRSLESMRQAGRERMAAIANQQKDKTLAANAAQNAIENHAKEVSTSLREYEILKTMLSKGLVAEDDPDLRAAYGKYAALREEHAGMLESMPAPTPTAAPDAKQQVLDAFSALPPERQTDEEMLRMLKAAGLR